MSTDSPLRRPPTRLFHFTSVDNLATIVGRGLLSDNRARAEAPGLVDVGNQEIKARRRARRVPSGGVVADYVPFYFAPRSPMMFRVCDKGRGVAAESLVYLCTTVEAVSSAGGQWIATDRNAVLDVATYTDDLDELEHVIDWELMDAHMWNNTADSPDRMERRMAECLVRDSVPWSAIAAIGCRTQLVAEEVAGILAVSEGGVDVIVRPGWYF